MKTRSQSNWSGLEREDGMQWVLWLDKHPGAATALPTVLLVIVTAWLGVLTWLTARRTKDLAQRSWDSLKLQIALTLVHEHERLRWRPDPQRFLGRDPAEHIAYLTAPLLAALSEESQQAEVRTLIKLVFGVEPRYRHRSGTAAPAERE